MFGLLIGAVTGFFGCITGGTGRENFELTKENNDLKEENKRLKTEIKANRKNLQHINQSLDTKTNELKNVHDTYFDEHLEWEKWKEAQDLALMRKKDRANKAHDEIMSGSDDDDDDKEEKKKDKKEDLADEIIKKIKEENDIPNEIEI